MARVEFTRAAVEGTSRLRVTHSLPPDPGERIKASLLALEQFPRLGTALEGTEWEGLRFVLGPWRWMVIVYAIFDDGERVVIVTVQDGRSSHAAATHVV